MLVHPSLPDVLSLDDWIPGRAVWPGLSECPQCDPRRLCCGSDSLATDGSARVSSKCSSVISNPGSQVLTRFDTTRRSTTQLVVHPLTKLADAAIAWLAKDPLEGRASIASRVVVDRVPCCTESSAKQRDGSTTRSHDVSAEDDNRFQLPEPTGSPQRSRGNLNARFERSLTLMTLGRTVPRPSPLYSGVRNRLQKRFRRWLTIRVQQDISVSPRLQCNCFLRRILR